MFLFITHGSYHGKESGDLNTSHVLIYHKSRAAFGEVLGDLNTSHVLIYRKDKLHNRITEEFKYISCSYLSG